MKQLIVAALAAVMVAGVTMPVQAAGLRKREHRLEHEIAHRQTQRVRKVNRWARRHPHPSLKAESRFAKRMRKQSRITARKERKAAHLRSRIARHHH